MIVSCLQILLTKFLGLHEFHCESILFLSMSFEKGSILPQQQKFDESKITFTSSIS